MNTNIDSLVEIINNNEVVTSSRQVAKLFGKQHKHVIEAINNKINSVENSAQYKKMFFPAKYKDASGKQNKMYYMNRDETALPF